jgi:cytochrome c-type biogenesis protein CcmH/NrfG
MTLKIPFLLMTAGFPLFLGLTNKRKNKTLSSTAKPPKFERRFHNQDKPFDCGRKAISRHVMLVIAAAVALVAVASRPTVKMEQTAFLPKPDIQRSDDPDTVAFIDIYLRHGSQFDPRQNAN